jgi:hypothetical protein
MQEHDVAGTNRLNFEEWSLEDLARIVPDQTQTLHKRATEYATVQQLQTKPSNSLSWCRVVCV